MSGHAARDNTHEKRDIELADRRDYNPLPAAEEAEEAAAEEEELLLDCI